MSDCSPPTRLHALIIGIDKYEAAERLWGCVHDSMAVEEFLVEDLQVPRTQIVSLRNEEASRGAVIQAFRDLADQVNILWDDPIFIFFAGHGSELDAPEAWKAGGHGSKPVAPLSGAFGKFQAILPQDYNTGTVHAIPDRTIGALLIKIAQKKGNNIVSTRNWFN